MLTNITDIHIPIQAETRIIYLTSILLVIAALVALPFATIDVSVRAAAAIRPASEVSTIRSITSGRIKEVYAMDNKMVKKGELLFSLDTELINEQARYYQEKLANAVSLIADARNALALTASRLPPPSNQFNTNYYRQNYDTYRQKLSGVSVHHSKVLKVHNRQQKLFQQLVIPAAEFENNQFELKEAENAIRELEHVQRSVWEEELRTHIEHVKEVESQLEKIEKEKDALLIRAPVTGTLQNVTGIYSGSTILANQDLAQLSPDTILTVIAYVKTSDIGLLKEGMSVRFQVDAFNFHQWGLSHGKIINLPSDIKVIDNRAVFEVKCSLERDFLQLKNGYRGFLRKGMTLQARFLVTRRTAWQLLYDTMNDWLNPDVTTGQYMP